MITYEILLSIKLLKALFQRTQRVGGYHGIPMAAKSRRVTLSIKLKQPLIRCRAEAA